MGGGQRERGKEGVEDRGREEGEPFLLLQGPPPELSASAERLPQRQRGRFCCSTCARIRDRGPLHRYAHTARTGLACVAVVYSRSGCD